MDHLAGGAYKIPLMKKVLIISYFFPPCNLTASQRAYSFAKYLKKYGYYPIIITRRWDHDIHHLNDISKATSLSLDYEINSDFEVYYLPFKGNLKDRFYAMYGNRMNFFRRGISFIELIWQYFSDKYIPFRNFLKKAQKLIEKDKDIKAVFISGNPFIQFKFGYKLHRKYNIPWIADYRDAWNTSQIDALGRSRLYKVLVPLEAHFEKKWVGTSSGITSVSAPLVDDISAYTGIKGTVLQNGFVLEPFDVLGELPKFETFTITYIGTLYEGQQIEMFCEAFKKVIDSGLNIKLLFVGLAFSRAQESRVNRLLAGYEEHYECTPRMEQDKVLEIEKRSHLLLHVAWKGFRGIVASKIYEYIASGTPILVVPGDDGEIDNIIKDSGCGVVLNSVEEVYEYLYDQYNKMQEGTVVKNDPGAPHLFKYSREFQAQKLAELLNTIVHD